MYLQITTATAIAVLSANVHASTSDWGVHAVRERAVSVRADGAFEDIFLFDLEDTIRLSATARTPGGADGRRIDDGLLRLFRDDGDTDTELASQAFGTFRRNEAATFGVLDAGRYYYVLSGTARSPGLDYLLRSSVTAALPEPALPEPALPEPASLGLALAALAALGLATRQGRPHRISWARLLKRVLAAT